MKKVLILAVCLTLLMSAFILPTSAAVIDPDPIEPNWTNTNSANLTLDALPGTGYAGVAVTKKPAATFAEGTVTVYKKINNSWVYVNSAYNSTTRMSLGVSVEFECIPGVEYKAVADVNVYNGSNCENIVQTVTKVCPSLS